MQRRIDAHRHFWRYDPVEHGWINDQNAHNPPRFSARGFAPGNSASRHIRCHLGSGETDTRRNALAAELIFERHLPQTIEFVDRHPDQIFVVDHLAKPRVSDRKLSPWQENLYELAKRPNTYCKLSGLVTEANYSNWSIEQLTPYLDTALSAFGPNRLMFGSDWPVCLVAIDYPEWAAIVANAISGLSPSEQERIWSGTAQEAYRT